MTTRSDPNHAGDHPELAAVDQRRDVRRQCARPAMSAIIYTRSSTWARAITDGRRQPCVLRKPVIPGFVGRAGQSGEAHHRS